MKKITNFHITVFGRVQGVGYRAFTQRAARMHGISGHVRNKPDGSVYIEAEGTEESLTNFIKLCKEGPGWSHVERIQYTEYPKQGYEGFQIKY